MARVIPIPFAFQPPGSSLSILGGSTDSPAFAAADPMRIPALCTGGTSTKSC